MVEVELGLNRPSSIPIKIVEKDFMFKVEVGTGIRPATLHRASLEFVINCWVSHFLLLLYMGGNVNTRGVDIVDMYLIRVISVVMMVIGGEIQVVIMVT